MVHSVMAFNRFPVHYCFHKGLCYFAIFLLSPSNQSASALVPASAACSSTAYPNFCNSILGRNASANCFENGRWSITRSMSVSVKFSRLVDHYLRHRSAYSDATVRVLLDCQELSELNTEFLSTTLASLSTNTTIDAVKADDVETLLSAIVTNQQTCLDGLTTAPSAASVKNDLSPSIFNSTRLYSVSLALVRQTWAPGKRSKQRPAARTAVAGVDAVRRGRLNLRMSSKNREIFESSCGRRKLLQASDSVLIRDVVVVNKDGAGNFTTINDAVDAAPNNTQPVNGYNETVSIARNKKYLMMIGDGINETVIPGNRSIIDEWTI